MPPTAAPHPSAADLAAFALGKLAPDAAAAVGSHLGDCPTCRAAVEDTPADSLVGLLRQAKPADPAAATPSVQGAVTRSVLGRPVPPVDPADLPPELRDHPRYRVLSRLGHGGMGVVYLAEHTVMARRVAVKVISRALVDRPEALERFNREVRAAAALDHPNIVKAFDAEQAEDLQVLVMEYVERLSLADVLDRKGPLPVAHACHYARQAALGLQHAHERGMVHRDLKPHNLMLTPKGVVKVLDFGLAKVRAERAAGQHATGADVVLGTPEYMAPEQALNTKDADIRADLYALGCTLFHLLTGRPPFAGDTPLAVVMAQMQAAPPAVETLRPDVPPELADLVRRMLTKDPARRPQTPKEVADALAQFTKPARAATPPPASPPPAAPTPTPRPRRRWLVPAAVATALLFAGAGLWAGGVFKVKTAAGTIVLEKLPADADVTIDGEKVTLTTGDGNTVTIGVAAGKKQRLEVRKDGFTTFGEEVEIAAGARQTITVRLEPTGGPGDGAAGAKGNGPAAAVLAPEQSEWAGMGVWKGEGIERPIGGTWTITERRGRAFKALWRAGFGWKAIFEGVIDDAGRITVQTRELLAPEPKPREDIKGTGEVGTDRMTVTVEEPGTGATARVEFKRLPDGGKGFDFQGRWKCFHRPNGWTGFRTVTDDTHFTDFNGARDTWERDGGLIIVHFPNGGREWLVIDPDRPNELNGSNGPQAVTWVRQ
jgi:tRNA A-37 threonylcarbamoyl transferase component Bud32